MAVSESQYSRLPCSTCGPVEGGEGGTRGRDRGRGRRQPAASVAVAAPAASLRAAAVRGSEVTRGPVA
jgi:hypothetical protein